GRSDDMFKVRGVQVFPAQIDTALSDVPGLGSEYQVVLTRDGGRERFLVRVEAEPAAGLAERATEALRDGLGVRPDVELVPPGGLPRTERKARRVLDER